MTAQTACGVKTCTSYWAPAKETTTAATGDYAVELNISTTQPISTGTAFGFDMQISIDLSSGTTVTADIYVDSGVDSSTTATATLYLNVYIDTGVLNSATAPTISSYAVTANACSSATSCP